MLRCLAVLHAITPTFAASSDSDESGEVNTAAILAWMVLAVVAIAAVNLVFGDLVETVFADVKDRILGIG